MIIIIITIIISLNAFRTVAYVSTKVRKPNVSDLNVASLMKLNFAFIAATRHPNL